MGYDADMEKYDVELNKRKLTLINHKVRNQDVYICFPESVTAFRESFMSITEASDNHLIKGPGKQKFDSLKFIRRINRMYMNEFGLMYDEAVGAIAFDGEYLNRFVKWFTPNQTEVDLLNLFQDLSSVEYKHGEIIVRKKFAVAAIQPGNHKWQGKMLRHIMAYALASLDQEFRNTVLEVWDQVTPELKQQAMVRFGLLRSNLYPIAYAAHIIENGGRSIFCNPEHRKKVESLFYYHFSLDLFDHIVDFSTKSSADKNYG